MAASAAGSTIGAAAMANFGSLVQQAASTTAEGNFHVPLLNVDCMKSMKGADVDGGHLHISILPNNTQASRLASFAVAATAWVGLSMCPVEALAMAYIDGDHPNVGESALLSTTTSMLQLSGYMGDLRSRGLEEDGIQAIAVANVPSIKPPNEGLNSPWVPKINGLKKLKGGVNSKGTMIRCPKWTESELEMVLPDFQGRPKPFPRMQGPFWPATAPPSSSDNNDNDNDNNDEPYLFLIQDKLNQPNEELVQASRAATPSHGTHDDENLPSSPPAPPSQQAQVPIKKLSCYTM